MDAASPHSALARRPPPAIGGDDRDLAERPADRGDTRSGHAPLPTTTAARPPSRGAQAPWGATISEPGVEAGAGERGYRALAVAATRQARELELLDRVRAAIAREIELPVLFRAVVDAVADVFGYTMVSLYLIEDDHLLLQHAVGYHRVLDRIPLERGVMGRVARTGEPALVGDRRADPDAIWAFAGIAAEACVPLRDRGRVVGVLNLESTDGSALGEADLRLLLALTDHVSVAIERARLYAEARASEARFRAMLDTVSDVVSVVAADGTYRYVSPAVAGLLGHLPDDLLGQSIFALVHPDDEPAARQAFAAYVQHPAAAHRLEARLRHRDGSWRRLDIAGNASPSDPSLGGVVLVARDVTGRRAVEERYRSLVENLPAITYVGAEDANGRFRSVYVSPQIEAILGWSPEECLADPEHWLKTIHPDDRAWVEAEDARTNATGEPFDVEYRVVARDGRVVWLRDMAVLVEAMAGGGRVWQGVQFDVSKIKETEARLHHLAFHDSLTGLPNRARFIDRLGDALGAPARPGAAVGVLFLDLDGFKTVNDSLGHAAGDELLVGVGRRLRASVPAEATLARFGGDEFAILLTTDGAGAASRLAESLLAALQHPFVVEGRETFVTAAIGIATSDADGADAGAVLREADTALYRAKAAGRGTCAVYEPGLWAPIVARLERETALRRAVERDELFLAYQPVVETTSGTVVGAEALVRWRHPKEGPLPPAAFVRLAEETGIIAPLGRWVLREACRQLRDWLARHPDAPCLTVGVNLSGRQLRRPGLVAEVEAALAEAGLAPDRLELEITERPMATIDAETRRTLRRLRGLGVRVVLDDFGTGFGSLASLRQLPVDGLKLDRTFVAGLGEDAAGVPILRAITALAADLGVTVTAEGVETADELARLRRLGVTRVQGFHIAAPTTSAAFADLLTRAGGAIAPARHTDRSGWKPRSPLLAGTR